VVFLVTHHAPGKLDPESRTMSSTTPDQTAMAAPPADFIFRKVDKVPFLELLNGRLQGVVSADSDPNRVYCCFIEAITGNYSSRTNNNRSDNGLSKHMSSLVHEAMAQLGRDRLLRYLQVPAHGHFMHGRLKDEQAGTVFSRFLNYLRFVERKTAPGPVPEMQWFVSR
jgi:hypothetical protein